MNPLAISLLAFVALALPTIAAEKPNIIVFLVDDMGVMDTSVPFLTDDAGEPVVYPLNEWYRNPSMARLAAQGIRFSTFYAQSVCSSTRATLMTGQNATRHATTQWIRPEGDNGRKYFTSYRNGDWKLIYRYYPKFYEERNSIIAYS